VSQDKSYFIPSYIIVVLAVIAFLGFQEVLPEKIFTETKADLKNVAVDSLMLEAVNDTVANPADSLITQSRINLAAVNGIKFPSETFDEYKGNQALATFFEKLLQLETTGQGNVRIAYFGDSMTDGDLIVKDFREEMQSRFGGEGVGFVNITSESAPSRSTLTHQYSTNWKTVSYLKGKASAKPYGITGHVFFAKHDTVNPVWIKFRAVNKPHISSLNNPTLFYGRSGNTKASLRVTIGNDTITKKLNPTGLLNTTRLADNVKGFKADFIKADTIPVYGFNFDDGKGVHVDNFGTRGNSGLPNKILDKNLMNAFNDKLGYDLIILHYGTNVLGNGTLNFTWYENRMAAVVAHLRECFPGVSILIISTADKSTKYDTEMKTDSAVVPLADAQKRCAVKTQSAYVNLYTLMGGDGSMVKWVDEEVPALANKDYTHFNMRGAKKVSGLIFKQLNEGYEQYKRLRGKKTPQAPKQPQPDSVQPETKIPVQPRPVKMAPKPDSITRKDSLTDGK
jgi:lysophospholipase L1-like esterase